MKVNKSKEYQDTESGLFKVDVIESIPNYQFESSYSFNVGLAQKYGVNESILLNHIIFWIKKNKANEKHYYEGYYWTYNSIKAFNELFPFWSKDQIRRILEKLEKNGIIKSGNFNKAAYDRTKWYTIIDIPILRFCQMDIAQMPEGYGKNHKPIPDINTVNKPYRDIVNYLNEKTFRNYRYTKSTIDIIKARFNEGFIYEDFIKVIDYKVSQWLTDEKMNIYLRPSTLFSNKFDSYLNSIPNLKPESSAENTEDEMRRVYGK